VPGDNDITWKGILVGFLLAGIVGFVINQILWRWGLGPIRAFFRPQSISQRTTKSPFQVYVGFLRGIAILGTFILAILYSTGMLEHNPLFLPSMGILRTLRSDQILTLLVVGLIVIIVAFGLGASEKGNREQK
jgi:zinc transporter ZupT